MPFSIFVLILVDHLFLEKELMKIDMCMCANIVALRRP